MHILPVLAGLEVLVLGGGPDIFFFVHLNCASNSPSNPPRNIWDLVHSVVSARVMSLVRCFHPIRSVGGGSEFGPSCSR